MLPDIGKDVSGDRDNSSPNLELDFSVDAETIFDQIDFCTPSMVPLSPNDFVMPYILKYKDYFKCKISKLKYDFVDSALCVHSFSRLKLIAFKICPTVPLSFPCIAATS